MNKVIKNINERLSCREYSNKKVSLKRIMEVAEAGKLAPSACNNQICNILVVKSKRYVDLLRKLSIEVRGRDCFYGASTMLIVYGPREDKFTVQDASCILENMFLAATSLGINSCWINQVDELFSAPSGEKIRKRFGLTENDRVVGTCILGYKKDTTVLTPRKRKDDFIKVL